MTAQERLEQLKSLRDHCAAMAASPDTDGIWAADVDALDCAIRMMEEAEEHECETE